MKLPFLSRETDNTQAHPSTLEGNVRRKLLLERKNKVEKQDRSAWVCYEEHCDSNQDGWEDHGERAKD